MKTNKRRVFTTIQLAASSSWNASKVITVALILLSCIAGFSIFLETWGISNVVNKLTSLKQSDSTDNKLIFMAMTFPAIVLILAIFSKQIADTVRPLLTGYLNEQVGESLKKQCYEKALNISLEKFESEQYYDQLERAQLASGKRLVEALQQFGNALSLIIETAVISVLIGKVSWVLTIIILVAVIPLVLLNIKANQIFGHVNYDQTPLRRKINYWRNLSTNRESAAELRLFGLGKFFLNRWGLLSQQLIQELFRARRKIAIKQFCFKMFTILLVGLVAVWTVYTGINGFISIGLLVSTFYMINRLTFVITDLSFNCEEMTRFYYDFRYVPEFLQLGEERTKTRLDVPKRLKHGISFEDVSFNYPGSSNLAIKQINLHIHPGENIAIVGENGAGKSTLARLLLGLYKPNRGKILIDDVNLSEIDQALWRKKAGAVFQNFMKYQLTVRENIGFGNVEKLKNNNELRGAAIRSMAHPFIQQFPDGYETVLGKQYEESYDLSGGQWQKLAIARAYFRDSPVLVFDEPTAALDAQAEYVLYQQFTRVSEGKTVFLISHRLGSARLADRILFMDQGQIIEIGSHQQLLARNGRYAELYRMQSEWYKESGKGE